jgi:siroheme synthase-like protein
MYPYYPVFLNIEHKKCVVIGGGSVAFRKVKVLREHGADVQVISPDLCPELKELRAQRKISVSSRQYMKGDLASAIIAVAATDDSHLNRKVAQEARREGILVNVVDDPKHSNFIVPSYLRRGDITIAISTGGKSPALARKIRARLEKDFGDEYTSLVLLISEVRSELKRSRIKISGDDWQKVLDLHLLIKMVEAGQTEKAKAFLISKLAERSQKK